MSALVFQGHFGRLGMSGFVIFIVPLLAACGRTSEPHDPVLTISAASNLIPAFEEIGELFEDETDIEVDFNFGASGQLAEQISRGAPVDLFASADSAYIDVLSTEGLILEPTVTEFARGRIVLWSADPEEIRLDDVRDLDQAAVETVALANPAISPFGQAAREALERAGLWESLEDKIVYGSNISQTLHMAEVGSADAAIVALSLVQDSDRGWSLIPESQHKPIRQVIAVLRGTENEGAARSFIDFIIRDPGQEILRRFGYEGATP